jgi:hypothetical protein
MEFFFSPEVEKGGNTQDWVRNPFYSANINSSDLPLKLKENLL